MDTSSVHHSTPEIGSELYWAMLEAPSLRDLAELVSRLSDEKKDRHLEWLGAELRVVRELRDVRCGLVILAQALALKGPGWARRQADLGKVEWAWILAAKAAKPGSEHRRVKDKKYNASSKGLARKKVYRATLKSGGAL